MKSPSFNLSRWIRKADWNPEDFPSLSIKQLVNMSALNALYSAAGDSKYNYKIKPAIKELQKYRITDIGKLIVQAINWILFENQQECRASIWCRFSLDEKKAIKSRAIQLLRTVMNEIIAENEKKQK